MHEELESKAIHRRGAPLSERKGQAGKYRDIAALGRGGMGDVHLTVSSAPAGEHKVLVIKRLRSILATDAEFLQKFLDEARRAAVLRHPNIAATHEVGFDGRRYFIAREYLDGQPLSELGRQSSATGGLPLAMQLRVLADALAGLHYAHEQRAAGRARIVHGDFSPSNIFVLYDGTVKLVDFGIANTAYSGRTKADIVKGKIQYVAPEQYAACPIDRRTDIYSAGVILWEAATHRRMWSGLADVATAQRVASGDIPLPSSIEPGIPKRLEAICMRALAVRPEERYATAGDFRAEIESFLDELGEPFSADDVGELVAEIGAPRRSRLDKLISDQLGLLRREAASLSLAPTVTSPRTLIEDLLGGEQLDRSSVWRPRSALGFATAGVLLGLLTGLVLVLLSRWSDASRHTAAAARPANDLSHGTPSRQASSTPHTARALAAASGLRKTRLDVETVPSSARVGIDGSLLPIDARQVVMVNDRAAHRVWAEAPGFQTKAEWVRLEGDQLTVRLVLVPVEQARPPSRSSNQEPARPGLVAAKRSSGSVPAAPSATSAPSVRQLDSAPKPSRARIQLDATDPWKN
jgi:serine/threonine-protein kinase